MSKLKNDTTHLSIQCLRGKDKPFRRFGREYGPEPTLVPVAEFKLGEGEVPPKGMSRDYMSREMLGAHMADMLRVEQVVIKDAPAPAKGKPQRRG